MTGLSKEGVGHVLTEDDGLVGIDWDLCRNSDAGEVKQWVVDIGRRRDSYTEPPRRALAFQCLAGASYTQRQQA